jgi:hypothetical protein
MDELPSQPDFLLRNARLKGGGRRTDLLISGGCVQPGSVASGSCETIDLDGRLVLPGLWDAHVHFDQWAAAKQRLDLSGVRSARELAALVTDRLAVAPPPAGTVLLGYGFRDGLWPDMPTADLLDTASPDVPVVMISGDLHSAWLNSVALQRFGRGGHPTGLLSENDWLPIMSEVARVPEAVSDVWAAQAASDAAARGVVGIVDFEAPDSAVAWTRRIAAGAGNLRVVCSVWPTRLDAAIDRGLRSGDAIPGTCGLATTGPLKVITDGSLNTRTAYCHDPYPGLAGQPNACGVLSCPPEQLIPLGIGPTHWSLTRSEPLAATGPSSMPNFSMSMTSPASPRWGSPRACSPNMPSTTGMSPTAIGWGGPTGPSPTAVCSPRELDSRSAPMHPLHPSTRGSRSPPQSAGPGTIGPRGIPSRNCPWVSPCPHRRAAVMNSERAMWPTWWCWMPTHLPRRPPSCG